MKIKRLFIFGKEITLPQVKNVNPILEYCKDFEEVYIYEHFKAQLVKKNCKIPSQFKIFTEIEAPVKDACMLTLGGDGTLLDAILLMYKQQVPILGINLGRLGFLATIAISEVASALQSLHLGKYAIENRTTLKAQSKTNIFGNKNFGLNELTLHKRDTSAMISIHVYTNDTFLNTYWADGLIISTPTGSTAYSLSCGGPIVMPGSGNFVITPVAPHNLNVRPIVIPDHLSVKVRVEGRAKYFMASLDSRSEVIDADNEIIITKNDFQIPLIHLKDQNYPLTIRKKLNWGLDIRN